MEAGWRALDEGRLADAKREANLAEGLDGEAPEIPTLRGAILHVQRLLNLEGYPVLRVDADGSTVVLDEALLGEQFGIRS